MPKLHDKCAVCAVAIPEPHWNPDCRRCQHCGALLCLLCVCGCERKEEKS